VFFPSSCKRIKLSFCLKKMQRNKGEIKKMNSFKKIAVALAAALSFGTLSAIPSNSAVLADSFAIDATADTIIAGETATAVLTLTFIAENSGDTVSVLSLVTSQPSAANKTSTLSVAETTSAVVTLNAGETTADVSSTTNSATQVTAKLNAYLVAPTVAGTYVVNFYPVLKSSGGKITSAPLTWNVTVNAPDLKASAATSTSFINKGETISATSDDKVFAPKALSADAAAVIVVTQKNAAGAQASESLTVTISGPGLVGHGTNHATISPLGRAIIVPAGSFIGVFSDGTAGVGTVTVTTASNVVLATKQVTFYGDITKIVAVADKPVLAVGSNANALTAVAYDENGVVVGNGTLYATSDTSAVVSNSATSATIVDGIAKFNLVGVKAGTAKVVVYSGTVADTATVRVEGTAAKVAIAFDKDQYTPGEAATITVSVTDADGLPLSGNQTFANLFATGGITSSYAFGAGSDAINVVSVTTDTKTATKTFKVFMPTAEVDVIISATGGASLPLSDRVLVLDTATVFNPTRAATDEAVKAAQAATEASIEATTAALAAQDAADKAATASADAAVQAKAALDAVNLLAVEVAKIVANFAKLQKSVSKIAKRFKK
jgi:hypothetical protein